MTIGEKIRKLRRERNWTQDQLGARVGKHGRHIGRYEIGKVNPSKKALKKIADAFGVSVDEFTANSTQPNLEAMFKDKELLELFQEIQELDEEDRTALKRIAHIAVKHHRLEEFILKK